MKRSDSTEPARALQRPATDGAAAEGGAELEGLAVTHWFDTEPRDAPYARTVRFTGQRIGVRGRPGPQDAFVKEETITGIVSGSGPVSITTWVQGLRPGEWAVTADLVRETSGVRARHLSAAGKPAAKTLPRAAWSWRRWTLATGGFAPVRTRWGPLVRLTPMPAVIPGSWPGLIAIGVVVGAVVQAALLARAGVAVGPSLLVDLLALLSGLLVAKVWYLALRPRRTWRESIGEGWTVDCCIFAAPAAAVAALLALSLPVGPFFDASAPALFVGVAIGRLGCFFTGCCAGRCTRSSWGVWSSDRRVGARRIPTQLLESAAALLIAGAATPLVLGSAGPPGAVFVAAAATYVFVRQFLLRLRAEPHNPIRVRVTAALAAIVLLAAVAALLLNALT